MDSNVKKLVRLALEEDFVTNDVTSKLCIDPKQKATGYLLSKEEGIFCGNLLIPIIVDEYKAMSGSSLVEFEKIIEDGQAFKPNQKLALFSSSNLSLLSLERTILNFIQRLCGIATLTKKYVDAANSNTILDTRKSIPGHRALDKYAVTAGQGKNHRMNLSDMILIKNNHIDGINSDFQKLSSLLKANSTIPVEVEVRNQKELENVLKFLSPNTIMLDNYSDDQIPNAVSQIRAVNPNIQIELSGSMNLDRVAKLANIVQGVSISVGGLFTKVQNIDISMRIEPTK
jgi:nicotinate-nucleotide pyrophosphorylase (carboxylating)